MRFIGVVRGDLLGTKVENVYPVTVAVVTVLLTIFIREGGWGV